MGKVPTTKISGERGVPAGIRVRRRGEFWAWPVGRTQEGGTTGRVRS